MKQMNVVLCAILLSLIWGSGSLYGKVTPRESDALRTLFNAADGGNWTKRVNWNGAPGTENTWYGITCDADNTTVLQVNLRDNNLSGTLPAELGDLSNLQTLVLGDNRLEGIHEALGKLSNLTTLDLSNNQLTGPIPSWIGSLKNLKKLNLSYNRFSGGIPSWIGDLKNLEELLLDGNQLDGPIPGEMGNLSKLTVLRLGHNRLVGEIPAAVGKLPRLADNRCNFKWNGLYTHNDSLRAFLKKKQTGQDWESTQTVPPVGITAVSPSVHSVIIGWEPLAYTADGGGCRVFYGATRGGPYTPGPFTDDKTISELEVKDLEKSTTYYFVVQAWTDRHGSNRNRVESTFSKELSASTRGTTISGIVKTSKGEGVPGVELQASDNGGKTFSDSKGKYYLSVAPGWSGTVTPSRRGFDFSPPALGYTGVNADRDGENYTAEPNTKISGKVTDLKGQGVPGVMLTFADSVGTATAVTGSTGYYIYTVQYNWKGTVIPSKTGYRFDPVSREYSGVTSARAGKEYKAFRPPEIGGRVKSRGGSGIADVTLTFSSIEKTGAPKKDEPVGTNEKGEYSKRVPDNWSGRVTPAKPGYIFHPANKDYENMTIDTVKIAEDYRVESDLKFFISLIGNYMIPAQGNFSDVYGSGLLYPGIKAGCKLFRPIYIWGGYDVSSKSGISPVFEEPSKWKESFLSMGFGYYANKSIYFGYKAEIGMCYVRYTEEAFNREVTGKAIGVRIDGAGVFKISDRLYTEISIGYLFASDTIDEVSAKLGGLKGGIGLGFRF